MEPTLRTINAVISALFAAVDKARATREMRALADQVARK